MAQFDWLDEEENEVVNTYFKTGLNLNSLVQGIDSTYEKAKDESLPREERVEAINLYKTYSRTRDVLSKAADSAPVTDVPRPELDRFNTLKQEFKIYRDAQEQKRLYEESKPTTIKEHIVNVGKMLYGATVQPAIGVQQAALTTATASVAEFDKLAFATETLSRAITNNNLSPEERREAEKVLNARMEGKIYQPTNKIGQDIVNTLGVVGEVLTPLTPLLAQYVPAMSNPIALQNLTKRKQKVKETIDEGTSRINKENETNNSAEGILDEIMTDPASPKSKFVTLMLDNLDPEAVVAARDLGILDYLQPDHLTTSHAVRELLQGVKSLIANPAREAEFNNLQVVAQRAESILTDLGATLDRSEFSSNVFVDVSRVLKQLQDETTKVYSVIDSNPAVQVGQLPTNIFINWYETTALNKSSKVQQNPNLIGTPQDLMHSNIRALYKDYKDNEIQYSQIDNDTKDLGNVAYGDKKPVEKDLREAKQALMDDQKTYLSGFQYEGGTLAQQFELGVNSARVAKEFENDLRSLASKELDKLKKTVKEKDVVGLADTKSIKDFSKGQISNLENLMKIIEMAYRLDPDVLPETIALRKQEVLLDAIDQVIKKDNKEVQWKGFADWYEGVKSSSRAMEFLRNNLSPEAMKFLNDYALVAEGIGKAKKMSINTGRLSDLARSIRAYDTTYSNIMSELLQSVATESIAVSVTGVPVAGNILRRGVQGKKDPKVNAASAAIYDFIKSEELLNAVLDQATESSVKKAANSAKFKKVRAIVSNMYKDVEVKPSFINNPELFLSTIINRSQTKAEEEEEE